MAQQTLSIPNKTTGNLFSAAELNEIVDAVTDNANDAETRMTANEFDRHLGFADYNDTSTASTPVALAADTWTTLPNDGLGAFSQENLPTGMTTLLHSSTGALNITELTQYSDIFVRPDFTITPDSNNADLEFRFLLGTGANEYTLPTSYGRLDLGAGIEYRRSLSVLYIYAGDSNTIDNPIYLQVKLSASGSVVNAGMAVKVYKR